MLNLSERFLSDLYLIIDKLDLLLFIMILFDLNMSAYILMNGFLISGKIMLKLTRKNTTLIQKNYVIFDIVYRVLIFFVFIIIETCLIYRNVFNQIFI